MSSLGHPSNSSLPSGLHRYEGDISSLKLRLLFTNDELLSARPNLKQEQFGKQDQKHQGQKLNAGATTTTTTTENGSNLKNIERASSENIQNSNNNNIGSFHSSYLIERIRGKWIIEAEKKCLMEDMEDEGIELRLIKKPLLYRNCACGNKSRGSPCLLASNFNEQKVAKAGSKASERLSSKEADKVVREASRISLNAEENERNGGKAADVFLLNGLNQYGARLTTTTPTTNGSSKIGLTRSRRAFHWKDTSTVTSSRSNSNAGISNDGNISYKSAQNQYQNHTLARKLPSEMFNLYDYHSHKNLTENKDVMTKTTAKTCNVVSCCKDGEGNCVSSCFNCSLCCGGLSDCDEEISAVTDQATNEITNQETSSSESPKDRANYINLLVSDLYQRWLLLNEKRNLPVGLILANQRDLKARSNSIGGSSGGVDDTVEVDGLKVATEAQHFDSGRLSRGDEEVASQVVGDSDSALEPVSVTTSSLLAAQTRQEQSIGRQISSNKSTNADSDNISSIDEHCKAVEKVLNDHFSSTTKRAIAPSGSPCSHGEVLFIMMEKHDTNTVLHSENIETSVGVISGGGGGFLNSQPSFKHGEDNRDFSTIAIPSDSIALEGATFDKEKEEKEADKIGAGSRVQKQAPDQVSFDPNEDPMNAFSNIRSTDLSLDRSNQTKSDANLTKSINLNKLHQDHFDEEQIKLDDNNRTMPDKITGANSSSFSADKINPKTKNVSESSNKLIDEQLKVNQTIDIQQVAFDYNDADGWMQQEGQARQRRQQRRRQQRQHQQERRLKTSSNSNSNNRNTNTNTNINTNNDTSQDDSKLVVVCLGVIVIDTLNRFIQLKPDLNKLISIDICNGSKASSLGFYDSNNGNAGDHSSTKQLNESKSAKLETASNRCSATRMSTTTQSGFTSSEATRSVSLSGLVYQLEIVEAGGSFVGFNCAETKLAGRAEAERVLELVREQLLAPIHYSRRPLKPLDQSRASKATTMSKAATTKSSSNKELDIGGFLSPVGGSMLIKLQVNIHFASNFSKDCRNLYVKYKLFSKTKSNSKWKLRRSLLKGLKDDSVSVAPKAFYSGSFEASFNSQAKEEGQKVAQMSDLLIAEQWQKLKPTLQESAGTTWRGDDEFEKPKAKSIRANGRHKERENNDVAGEAACLADHDTTCILLLEGSTITSRSDSRGRFHFDCIEELVLESVGNKAQQANNHLLWSEEKLLLTPTTTKNKALSVDQHNTKSFESISNKSDVDCGYRKLADDVTTIKRDENSANTTLDETFTKLVGAGADEAHDKTKVDPRAIAEQQIAKQATKVTSDDYINDESGGESNINTGNEQNALNVLSSSTSTSALLLTAEIRNKASENNVEERSRADKNDSRNDNDLRNISTTIDHSRKDQLNSNSLVAPVSELNNNSNLINNNPAKTSHQLGKASSTKKTNSSRTDDDEIHEIVLILEFYSSDFYRDKLQGWSHLSIPVSLRRDSSPPKSSYISSMVDKKMGSKCMCTKRELPVIRPELCSLIDKLRYYLIGQLPDSASNVDSFSRCIQRYMLRTKQSGLVVLDYEIVRQFSDPNFDSAWRDIQQQLGKTTRKRPYESLNYEPFRPTSGNLNKPLFEQSYESSGEEQQESLDAQKVVDAYQKAKQRIEVLNLSSLLETSN